MSILHLEIQEGVEHMESKKYWVKYPKHVPLTLRLTEFLQGKSHIEYGDRYMYFAFFQTARALLVHGTYFHGFSKECHKRSF